MLRRINEIREQISNAFFNAYLSNASQYVVTKCTSMLEPVENFFIGDLRYLISKPHWFRDALEHSQYRSLGFFGNIMLIKPSDEKVMAQLIDTLDKQPKGRMGYQILAELTGGKVFFAESTSAEVMQKKRLLLSFFKDPKAFAACAKEAIDNVTNQIYKNDELAFPTPEKMKLFSKSVVRTILAKIIFGIDQIPANGHIALDKLHNQFNNSLVSSLLAPKFIKQFDKDIIDTKKLFDEFTNDFLESQVNIILDEIKNNPMSPNNHLAALMIQNIMKGEGLTENEMRSLTADQIRKYFNHPEVHSLPWVFFAGENIANVINIAMDNILTPKGYDLLAAQEYLNQLMAAPENGFSAIAFVHDFLAFQISPINSYQPSKPGVKTYTNSNPGVELLKEIAKEKYTGSEQSVKELLELIQGELHNRMNQYQGCVDNAFHHDGTINPDSLVKNQFLDLFYKNCLQCDGVKQLVRYSLHAVKVGDIEIPANTTVLIMPRADYQRSWSDYNSKRHEESSEHKISPTSSFRFFSAGKRRCPGFVIADYIFKGVIAEIVQSTENDVKEQMNKILGSQNISVKTASRL